MPCPKVLPSEDAERVLAHLSASILPPVLAWQQPPDVIESPCAHTSIIAPSPEQRALERLNRPIAEQLRTIPAAKIRQIKARIIPRERPGVDDNDLSLNFDGDGIPEPEPDIYSQGLFRVMDSFRYSTFPRGHLGGGSGRGPIIPATVIQRLPDVMDEARLAAQLLEHALIREQVEIFQQQQQEQATMIIEAASAAAASTAAAPTKRKNGSSGSDIDQLVATSGAVRGGSDGSGGSVQSSSACSGSSIGSIASSSFSSSSGNGSNFGSVASSESATKKARVDKKVAASSAAAAAATTSATMDPKFKRRRTKIPQASVEILQDWFQAHVTHPYPNDKEKADIMERANLDHTQFINCE